MRNIKTWVMAILCVTCAITLNLIAWQDESLIFAGIKLWMQSVGILMLIFLIPGSGYKMVKT